MNLSDVIKNCKLYVWRGTFAIVNSRRPRPDAFANIIDKKEITLVIEQSKVNKREVIDISRDWKLLTFDMVLPFGLVGFLARISEALANEGISIYVISAYSTDHILVKRQDIVKVRTTLKQLGCKLVKEPASAVHLKYRRNNP
jgi:hypothetical protein